MKRIGIIGGMSYESTVHYYTELNRLVNKQAGGLTSAEIFLRSVNFAEYYDWMQADLWSVIGAELAYEAKVLRHDCKCDYIAIATNTMHKVAGVVERQALFPINGHAPFVHIGDCIAEDCEQRNLRRVALLGTNFTMTEDFLVSYLAQHGITVDNAQSKIVSDPEIIDEIDRIIFEELCHGIYASGSLEFFRGLFNLLIQKEHFDGVILGCTELGEAFHRAHIPDFRLIDSTKVHIQKLANLALS